MPIISLQRFGERFGRPAVTRAADLLPGADDNWFDRGLCAQVDGETFFPEKGVPVAPARSICARCDVQQECLDYAVDNRIADGVWGGLTGRERRKIWRERDAAAAAAREAAAG